MQKPEENMMIFDVSGGTLSAARPAADRKELLDVCVENLPSSVAAGVRAGVEGGERRYSYLHILLILLALGGGFFLMYLFFPDTSIRVVESEKLLIADTFPAFPRDGAGRAEYVRAIRLYNDKHYDECCRLLAPLADRVLQELGPDGGKLFFLYLDSARRGTISPPERDKAREFAGKLREKLPDSLEVRLLEIELTPEVLLRYAKLPESVRSVPGVYFRRLDEAEKKRRSLGRDDKKIIRYLELTRAGLLLSGFVAEGREKNFPDDDLQSPGVAFREEALKIARRYPDSREAWEMRRFIAKTIKDHSYPGNFYYWDGERRYAPRHLDQELSSAKEALEKR